MKNPNDSFWNTYSDINLPEYAPKPPVVKLVGWDEIETLLNRRFVTRGWRAWRLFDRRKVQLSVRQKEIA